MTCRESVHGINLRLLTDIVIHPNVTVPITLRRRARNGPICRCGVGIRAESLFLELSDTALVQRHALSENLGSLRKL